MKCPGVTGEMKAFSWSRDGLFCFFDVRVRKAGGKFGGISKENMIELGIL
jgi:hypothetical protein